MEGNVKEKVIRADMYDSNYCNPKTLVNEIHNFKELLQTEETKVKIYPIVSSQIQHKNPSYSAVSKKIVTLRKTWLKSSHCSVAFQAIFRIFSHKA